MSYAPNMPSRAIPARTGSWSAIRDALRMEAAALADAEACERSGYVEAARSFRAEAAAHIAPYLPARPSTFDGEPPAVSPGQLSIFDR